jgi:hypothetical protein
MRLTIDGKKYEVEYDSKDPFVAPNFIVAYSHELAKDFMPILLDPRGKGSMPHPPDFIAYRLVLDPMSQKLCILYEVYWRRQECTWKELNKDHDHDYEQIQIHFNMMTGEKEKVIISSVGPVDYAGHGIEIYSNISKARVRNVEYTTSPKRHFPWGGELGKRRKGYVREIPIGQLVFEDRRPVVTVLNCYHAFSGLKQKILFEKRFALNPRLKKLDRGLIERWYFLHVKNRFGHDISNPFNEPYIMYFTPPEGLKSRLVYGILWLLTSILR